MEVVTVDVVRHCLGNKFGQFYYPPAHGTRGGILLAWDASVVALTSPHYMENTSQLWFNTSKECNGGSREYMARSWTRRRSSSCRSLRT